MFSFDHNFYNLTEDLKIILLLSFQFISFEKRNYFFVEVTDCSYTIFQHLFMMIVSTCIEIYVPASKEFLNFV